MLCRRGLNPRTRRTGPLCSANSRSGRVTRPQQVPKRCVVTLNTSRINTIPAAAEVNRKRLCRDAHSLLHNHRRLLATAWGELRLLEDEARGYVRSHCGNDPPVTLPRDAARGEMVKALTSARVLSVTGKSGVGKSALVCSALDNLQSTSSGNFESLYLNLRQLPPNSAALRAAVGAPLDDVFAEMTAPTRLVVIDAAGRAAETDDTPLTEIVRCAVGAGVAVCIVSASEASDTIEGLVAGAAGESPKRHSVPRSTMTRFASLPEPCRSLAPWWPTTEHADCCSSPYMSTFWPSQRLEARHSAIAPRWM